MSPIAARANPQRHRTGGGGGGGALSFVGQTSWARPTPGTPAAALAAGWHLVPFTTKAGLDSAISGMANHDYIYYNGTNVLSVNTSSGSPAWRVTNKNPSTMVAIDLGCSRNIWDSSKVSSGYVAFSSTYSSQSSCVLVEGCSNLAIYGGDVTSLHGYGIEMDTPCQGITMWDQYIHDVGSSGFWPRDALGSTAGFVKNCSFRMEVGRFCMDPSIDSHTDKGTGHHAGILHGNTGDFSGNLCAIYGHDPLRPGEVSFGTTWPEGSGGSVIEVGNNSGSQDNNTYYALGVNLLMIPNGNNPGSTAQQAGGNVVQLWGGTPMNNNIFGWIEGQNCTGGVMHCAAAGGYDNASPPMVVQHGRHTNCNQYTSGSSQGGDNAVAYNQAHGIIYQDCL